MPFKLIRFHHHKNEASETSNGAGLGSLGGRSNADYGGSQMGNLIQSLQGARLGDINAPLFSHNTIYNCQPSDNQDYAEIKVRDIILKKELKSDDADHELQSDGTVHEAGRIRSYEGYIYKDSSQPMLICKYEGLASKDWKRDLHMFSAIRHPNILQLYGLCNSKYFTALIFHSGHQHTFRDYHLSFSGPSFITYARDLLDQYISAADALLTQGLIPPEDMDLCDVDHAGQLVVHTFVPRSWGEEIWPGAATNRPIKDMQPLFFRFNFNSLSKASLEEYYELLLVICQLHGFFTFTNLNASMVHQDGTTALHVPKPYIYRLDNRYPGEDSILCKCMPDMSVRWTVPTSDLIGMKFHQGLVFGVQSTACGMTPTTPIFPIFNLWASQVHRLIKQMQINDMEVQTAIPHDIDIYCSAAPRMTGGSAGTAHGLLQYPLLYLWFHFTLSSDTWWWSTDLEGQTVISTTDIEDEFNISMLFGDRIYEYHIPQQIYPILWDIHKACGFNPDSTEMAEYLGYPLLEPVLEPTPGHSGLYKEEFSESDDYSSDGEMETEGNEEIGSDNDSENGSTSSNDTFFSTGSNI